jgi:hypothetical protein
VHPLPAAPSIHTTTTRVSSEQAQRHLQDDLVVDLDDVLCLCLVVLAVAAGVVVGHNAAPGHGANNGTIIGLLQISTAVKTPAAVAAHAEQVSTAAQQHTESTMVPSLAFFRSAQQ